MSHGGRGNRGRGGGHGRAANGNPSHSFQLPSSPASPTHLDRTTTANPTNPSNEDHCATCNQTVNDDCIGCDRCSNWFCPSGMCLGLPDELVRGIREFGGDAIAYICTDCRSTSPASGSDNPAFKQLLQTVKKLCETMHTLSAKVASLTTTPPPPLPPAPQPNPASAAQDHVPDESSRRLIREEIREMNERQKRVDSLIVRGIDAPDNSLFKQNFSSVTCYLLGNPVDFTDLICINRDKKLYRLKVTNSEARKSVLDKARNLKGSQFDGVFISRDLTYIQRQDLARRRRARVNSAPLDQQGSAHGNGATRDPETGPDGLTSDPPAPQAEAGSDFLVAERD